MPSTDFLRINGWTVTVLNGKPSANVLKVGNRKRSFRGRLRSSERNHRQSWTVEAVVRDNVEAEALINLMTLGGHFFDFKDGLQASTALQPGAGYPPSGVRLQPTSWGDFGKGVLTIAAATSGVILAIDAQLGDDWTVLCRRVNATTGVFEGVAQRSAGTSYVNGAASITFGFRPGSGGEQLRFHVLDGIVEVVKDGTATAETIDDLVILPWLASDSQLAAWTSEASSITKFGPLPMVRVDGKMVDSREIVCEPKFISSDFVAKTHELPGVGWTSNARIVRFSLTMIEESFAKYASDITRTPTPPGEPILWLDAGDVDLFRNATVAPGAALHQWKDKGSRSMHAVAVGTDPVLRHVGTFGEVDNAPAVKFVGTGRYETSSASPNISGPCTIAAVFMSTSVSGTAYLLDNKFGTYRARLYLQDDACGIGAAGTLESSNVFTAGQYNNVAGYAAPGAAGAISFNGYDEAGAISNGSSLPYGFTIGAQSAGSNFFEGNLCELIVWEDQIELNDVISYFLAKFKDITVSAEIK